MIRKFASADIIGAEMGTDAGFSKSAHRAVFNYTPREGYLYVRSRAISSRCNDNFDMFPADEISKSYMSFIGKPVFVNHHNEDHRRARGVIIDAALHQDKNPDGTPDTWAELLHEVDAVKFPKLAEAIINKDVNRTSMGCDVQFSKCSVCDNVATSPLEYCVHIPGKKGKRIVTMDAQWVDGKREAKLCFEICSGLSFFENSLLVEQPADPTAFFLGDVEMGPGLERLARVQAAYSESTGTPPPKVLVSGGIYGRFDKTASIKPVATGGPEPMTKIWDLIRQAAATDDDSLEAEPTPRQATAGMNWEDRDWYYTGDVQPPTNSLRRQAKLNDEEPVPSPQRPPKALHPDTGKPVPYTKEENTAWNQTTKAHANAWAKRNPIHPQNIIDHWNAGTSEEHDNGMNWYKDAHHTSNLIADGTGTPRHVMAGLVSNYSPQTHWATNVINAAKAARLKTGIGGKGNQDGHSQFPATGPNGKPHPRAGQTRGIMATEGQKQVANKLLSAPADEDEARANGTHYEKALKGRKTQAFARLIHNGGDDHSVVVDRHALSVASGARASDSAFEHSGLGTKKMYEHVSGAYKAAADHISKTTGTTVHPHQVQAATWLTRQRLNEEGDHALMQKGRSSAAAARRAIKEMSGYMGEHHPDVEAKMPGTGYAKESSESPNFNFLAYGETKAPQDVDTLRAENCTVCGNSSAFDGKQCQVCGYVAPPKAFGDPNVDIAQANDLRKQVVDGDEADPMDTDQPMGNQQGDPEELDQQQADADAGKDDQISTQLACNNCGTQVTPPPPTGDGEPPYPADGDVCPVCKKGQLLSGQDDAESDDAEVPPGSKEDADGDGIPDSKEDKDGDGIPDDQEEAEDDDDPENDDDDADEDDDTAPPKKKDKK